MVRRAAALDGSISVMVEETFHQVHFSVAPTKIAAQEKAGALGFLGSSEQEFTGEEASFIVERIPTNSFPVGMRAYALPTEVKP